MATRFASCPCRRSGPATVKEKKNSAMRVKVLALWISVPVARAWMPRDSAVWRRTNLCSSRRRTTEGADLRFGTLELHLASSKGSNSEYSSDSNPSLFDDESSDDGELLMSWEASARDEDSDHQQEQGSNDSIYDEDLGRILLDDDDSEHDDKAEVYPARIQEQSQQQSAVESNSDDPWGDPYRRWIDAAERARQNLQNKRRSLENELAKATSIETTVQRANYLTSHMYLFTPGVRSVSVQDWESGNEFELELDPAFDSASQEADALFQQARKLKRGSAKVAELLEETSAALAVLSDILQDFSGVDVVNESVVRLLQAKLLRTSGVTGFEPPPAEAPSPASRRPHRYASGKSAPPLGSPSSNVRKLRSPAGSVLLVGRNRRGNEYLSLSVARGDDLWLHARGRPGAHVLVPQRRGSPVATPECLQLAANVAVFYSDARSERRADVTVASPKHILKPRNAPTGAVQLRQEDRVVVGYPSDVPEELRLARDESGQSDEFRARDKSKNRKRTLTAAAASSTAANKARSKRKRSKSL